MNATCNYVVKMGEWRTTTAERDRIESSYMQNGYLTTEEGSELEKISISMYLVKI